MWNQRDVSEPSKPIVFVSYSHADEVEWLSFVVHHLWAAFAGMEVEIFTDRGMAGGAKWDAETERLLRACDAFLLLVSPNSMTSTYVVEKEIAIIREREKAGAAPLFVPLIIMNPTSDAALAFVRDQNWRPRGGKPL